MKFGGKGMLTPTEEYQQKFISISEALNHIKSGDEVVTAMAASQPPGLLNALGEKKEEVKDVKVITCLPLEAYSFYSQAGMEDSFTMESWFYGPHARKAAKEGRNVTYIPNHLHLASTRRFQYRTPDVFLGTATPMDKHGNFSLSLGITYEKDAIELADTVILEINENLPRTYGDININISQVDHLVENNTSLFTLPEIEPSELDHQIGGYIAELVENESTLQLGIGGIPNAVTKALETKKDLGIHTEMMTDGMVDLYYKGVITNHKKSIWKDKMIATFAYGSQKLYDFLDNNLGVEFQRGKIVNDPHVIGQNHKMVSINTALQVDLTGQVCSESLGHSIYSGTGGQCDTASGSQKSPGGKSIIALYSSVKDETISTIVPSLNQGAGVTLSRNDVDYVVTEYGVAPLRGRSIKERVENLISIAHPNFREELSSKAKHYGII